MRHILLRYHARSDGKCEEAASYTGSNIIRAKAGDRGVHSWRTGGRSLRAEGERGNGKVGRRVYRAGCCSVSGGVEHGCRMSVILTFSMNYHSTGTKTSV